MSKSDDLRWIRESNLIENVDDPDEDLRSFNAWKAFLKRKLTRQSVLECHKDIMSIMRPDIAGCIRHCNVRVGNYIAPHYEQVLQLLNDWFVRYKDVETAPQIKKAHVVFETIHPFEDGNGRTGRMIMNYQRIKAGFKSLCLKASERQEYYKWFRRLQ